MTSGVQRWERWTTSVVLALRDPKLASQAREIADQLMDLVEQACSGYRYDSEVNTVGRRAADRPPGSFQTISPMLAGALSVALEAAEVTDGMVTPTLGAGLVQYGFLPSFDDPGAALPGSPPSWRQVRLDRTANRSWQLSLDPGLRLDLGATAKAWTADLIATTVAQELDAEVAISLGGDVRASGPAGGFDPWPVQISETPHQRARWWATLTPSRPAIATSTVLHRRRFYGGRWVSHLLNPVSGEAIPATVSAERNRTAVAFAATACAANTLSTWSLLVTPDQAAAGLPRTQAQAAIVVRGNGTAEFSDRELSHA